MQNLKSYVVRDDNSIDGEMYTDVKRFLEDVVADIKLAKVGFGPQDITEINFSVNKLSFSMDADEVRELEYMIVVQEDMTEEDDKGWNGKILHIDMFPHHMGDVGKFDVEKAVQDFALNGIKGLRRRGIRALLTIYDLRSGHVAARASFDPSLKIAED